MDWLKFKNFKDQMNKRLDELIALALSALVVPKMDSRSVAGNDVEGASTNASDTSSQDECDEYDVRIFSWAFSQAPLALPPALVRPAEVPANLRYHARGRRDSQVTVWPSTRCSAVWAVEHDSIDHGEVQGVHGVSKGIGAHADGRLQLTRRSDRGPWPR